MNDLRIRRHGRLVDKLRAGQVYPKYTEATLITCVNSIPSSRYSLIHCRLNCPACQGSGFMEFDPMDLVRLRAFLGDAECREITEGFKRSSGSVRKWVGIDNVPLLDWLQALIRLLKRMPVAEATITCRDCGGNNPFHLVSICSCGKASDGTEVYQTPASRYLYTIARHAAAVEVLPIAAKSWKRPLFYNVHTVKEGLDLCQDWIDHPCPDTEAAYEETWYEDKPAWFPGNNNSSIEAAARLSPNIKKVIKTALLRIL